MSAIGAITLNGILDYKFIRGTTNGDLFLDFIEENLLPHLMPFDGTNENSIVVMDNCNIVTRLLHHAWFQLTITTSTCRTKAVLYVLHSY